MNITQQIYGVSFFEFVYEQLAQCTDSVIEQADLSENYLHVPMANFCFVVLIKTLKNLSK